MIGAAAAILVSFTYVVAQIYGVGLMTTHLTGVAFEIGMFGLGGILVCSFLGGMRAVTWTQVGQCIVLLIAYLVPVVWLSVKQTGIPLPLLSPVPEKVTAREAELMADPRERRRCRRLRSAERRAQAQDVPRRWARARPGSRAWPTLWRRTPAGAASWLPRRRAAPGPRCNNAAAARASCGRSSAPTTRRRTKPCRRHGATRRAVRVAIRMACARTNSGPLDSAQLPGLIPCLMMGTAALPHVLACYTPRPGRGRRASRSLDGSWSSSSCLAAPVLAVLVKFEVLKRPGRSRGSTNCRRGSPLVARPTRRWCRSGHQPRRHPAARRMRIGNDVVVLDARDRQAAVRRSAMVAVGALQLPR